MTWFKVDDGLVDHPKLASLEDGPCFAEAIALWTIAGAWCARHLQNGNVPRNALRKLTPYDATRAASELVRVGLWHETDTGWRFHEWETYQPSKSDVEKRREKTRERVKRHRQRNADTNGSGNGVTESVTNTYPRSGRDGSNLEGGEGGRAPSPEDLQSARDELWSELCAEHAKLKRELGLSAPGLPLTGPGPKALQDRLREVSEAEGVDAAKERCRHVLRVRAAEARAKKSLDWFGASIWSEGSFYVAVGREDPAAQAAGLAPADDPLERYYDELEQSGEVLG